MARTPKATKIVVRDGSGVATHVIDLGTVEAQTYGSPGAAEQPIITNPSTQAVSLEVITGDQSTTAPATLIFRDGSGGGGGGVAPTITTQPQSQTIPGGGTATLSVVATGTAPLSYQWRRNASNITGATSSTYGATLAGSYDVLVSNAIGTATSSSATVSISAVPDPAFTVSPPSGPVPLTVALTNTSPGTYQVGDTHAWVFGDGNTSTAASPGQHTYNSAGNRTITRTITRGGTTYGPHTQQVNVTAVGGGAPVVLDITHNAPASPIPLGTSITFGETHTGNVTGWSWVFISDGLAAPPNTNQTPTFSFGVPGLIRAEVTLTGPGGTSAVYGEDIGTVSGTAPPAPVVTDVIVNPSTGLTTATPVAFSETHTGALNSSGSHVWTFRINGAQVGTASVAAPTFTFPSPGEASVTLVLNGPGGASSLYSETIGQVTSPAGTTTNVVVTAGPAGNVVAAIVDAGTNEGSGTQNLGTDAYINMRRWAGNISRMWVALSNFDAARSAAEAYAASQTPGSTAATATAVRLRLRKLTNTPTDQPATIWVLAEAFTEAGSSHLNRTTGAAWTTPGGTKGAQIGTMTFPATGPADTLSSPLAGLLTSANRTNGVLIELDNLDAGGSLNVQPACREWSAEDAPEFEFDIEVTVSGGGGGHAPVVTDITYSPSSGLTTSTSVLFGEAHTGALNQANAYAWVFRINGAQVGSSGSATPTFTFPSAGAARAELRLTGPGGTSALYGEELGTVTTGSGGGGGLPAGMTIGYNIHGQAYYDQFGKLLNLAECSAYLGSSSSNVVPDYDGDGFVTINPGGSAVWHTFRELDTTTAGLVGSYVVAWTGAATCAVSGVGVTITSTAANRIVFTFDHSAFLSEQDTDYPHSALSGVFVQVLFGNPTGSPVKPSWYMTRVSDEARFLAGNRFTLAFINLIKTSSGNNVNGGFIRFLQAMAGITGWLQTTAEIPRNGGALPTGWDPADGPGGGVVKGGRGGAWSPELVARLCVEADRPAFLNLYAMIQDSAWTAWLTRFLAVYPSSMELLLEDGNETWIFGPQQNARYLRFNYSAAFGTSFITGPTEYLNQMYNAADCAFRQFRIARNLMGTRVRLAAGHQSTGFYSGTTTDFKLSRRDLYARWSPDTNVRMGDIVDHHAHGAYLSLNMGFPQNQSDTGDMFALMKNKAYENNSFTGGNALAYWQGRFATARDQYNSAMIQQNSQLASAGFPNSTLDIVYEGWNHDNYSPNFSFGTSSAALGMSSDGSKMVPANVTLTVYDGGGRTLPHASESAAQFFDDNDRAFIYYSSNTGLLRRGWLVKNTAGGIRLFASRAAYNADTATAVPAGTTAFVINESRMQRVLDYVHDTVWSQNTSTFATHLDACRARGVKHFSIYAFDQRTTMWRYMVQAGLGVDGKPWGIQKGGAIGTTSAVAAYVRDRPATGGAPPPPPVSSAKLAEVGHSLVNQNMPQYLAAIASSLGKTFSGTVQLIGGAALSYNWDNHTLAEVNGGTNPVFGDVFNALPAASPQHDVLVLTCRKPRPSTAETAQYGVLWRNRAVAANANCRVYYYTTWTGWDIDNSGNFWPGIENRVDWRAACESEGIIDEGVVDTMNAAITSGPEFLVIGGHRAMMALYDQVVPNVGGLWGWAGNTIDYFFGVNDDIHLNARGNYYIACVHYATIYRASPVGAAVPGGVPLTSGEAQQLQQLAWTVVSGYSRSGV